MLLPCWAPDSNKPTPLPERFYLGGVESNLRGFETRGVGPSEARRQQQRSSAGGASSSATSTPDVAGAGESLISRDAVGGDLFANIYAAVMLRLPGKAGDLGVHGHLFANGGSAVLLGGGSDGTAPADVGTGLGGKLGVLGEQLRNGAQHLGQAFRWTAGM